MTDQAELLPGTLDLLILKAHFARQAARVRRAPTDRADIGRCATDQARRVVPGALSSRASGPDHERMGHVGEQSKGEVLNRPGFSGDSVA